MYKNRKKKVISPKDKVNWIPDNRSTTEPIMYLFEDATSASSHSAFQ